MSDHDNVLRPPFTTGGRLAPELAPQQARASTALAMLIVAVDGAIRIAKISGALAILLLAAVGLVSLLGGGLPLRH